MRTVPVGEWFWLADPTIAEHYDHEEAIGAVSPADRQTEQDLVDAYVTWLGRDIRPHRFVNHREADLYDETRALLVEAKASADAVVGRLTPLAKCSTTARSASSASIKSQSCSPPRL